MKNALRSLWLEPSVPDPPRRVWRDWLVLGAFVTAVIVEGVFRDDIVWPLLAIPLGLVFMFALLERRSRPLVSVAVTFGSFTLLDVASLVASQESVELYSGGFVLLLVYALFRWASGRDVFIGLAFMLVALIVSVATDFTGAGDAIGGTIVLLFPAALGMSVRYQGTVRQQRVEQATLREREQIARELHDTVAHHVSAIAVQAQAGRFLTGSPTGVRDTLATIEEEASRALTEMRSMVGALRNGGSADLAPQRGVRDIEALAAADRPDGSPTIAVELSGVLDNVRASVGAAIYRLAQESITNSLRHASNATRIDVRVHAGNESVSVSISDNGDRTSLGSVAPGFGLLGMTERVALLGGTLNAGPGPNRGWTVTAVIPRQVV